MPKIILLLLFYSVMSFGQTLPIPAIIYPVQEAKISSPMTGVIEKLKLKEGQTFLKGEVLVKFECHLLQAELNKTTAVLSKKDAKYQGYRRLSQLKTISKMELIEAQADHQEALADNDMAKIAFDRCTITAPFSGQIIKRYAHAHEHIAEGDPLLDIVSFEEYEIKIVAPSNWIKWVKKDLPFKVKISEINKTYDATVKRFNHYIDPVSQTFTVFGSFNEKDQLISPGMSGQAIFSQSGSEEPILHH